MLVFSSSRSSNGITDRWLDELRSPDNSNWWNQFETYPLRLALGSVFLYHGISKLPGGPQGFAQSFGLPVWLALLVIIIEIASGLGLLIGNDAIAQLSAFGTIPILLGAIALVHWKNGFNFSNGGWEYQMVLLLIAYYLVTRQR